MFIGIFFSIFSFFSLTVLSEELYPSYRELFSPVHPLDEIKRSKFVSLVYAGKNLKSPISSFGHTSILFHNERLPHPTELVFEFLGDVRAPYLAIRSLIASIPGKVRLTPWHEKYWQYDKEDRDVWIIPLKIDSSEKKALIKEIEHYLKNPNSIRYNFILKNCSSVIFDILKKSFHSSNQCSMRFFYKTPIGSLHAFKRCQKLKIDQVEFIPSSLSRIEIAKSHLSKEEKKNLKDFNFWNFDSTRNYSKATQSAITEIVDYHIPRTPPGRLSSHLFLLKKTFHHKIKIKKTERKEIRELAISRSGRLTFKKKRNGYDLSFVPVQRSFYNTLRDQFWADQFEIMKLTVSKEGEELSFSELSFLDIVTTIPGRKYFRSFVRDIYIGYFNHYWKSIDFQERAIAIAFGYGWSRDLLRKTRLSLTLRLDLLKPFGDQKESFVFDMSSRLRAYFFSHNVFRVFFYWNKHFNLKLFKSIVDHELGIKSIVFDTGKWVGTLELFGYKFRSHSPWSNKYSLSVTWLF